MSRQPAGTTADREPGGGAALPAGKNGTSSASHGYHQILGLTPRARQLSIPFRAKKGT
jgi:hypothetical protein